MSDQQPRVFRLHSGFRFGAVARAGSRPGAARRDLALIVSERRARRPALHGQPLRAAPVDYGAGRLPAMGIRAIVANSGNANAITGPEGAVDERAVAAAVAAGLGVGQTRSDGVDGRHRHSHAGRPDRGRRAGAGRGAGRRVITAAEAIRTTDLARRSPSASWRSAAARSLRAIAKGSGMIHPQMATMFCFVTPTRRWRRGAAGGADRRGRGTFNTITVDGDMSTNDAVIALANGRSGAPAIERGSADFVSFAGGPDRMCADLARAIAADGEGATKLLVVDVAGVPERAVARDLARAVAGGSLVNSGIFGGDPSWGRILAALGARIGARSLAARPGARDARYPGRARLRQRRPGRLRRQGLAARMQKARDRRAPRSARGKGGGARAGLRSHVRLREDQRRVLQRLPRRPGAVTPDFRLTNRPAASTARCSSRRSRYIRRFAGQALRRSSTAGRAGRSGAEAQLRRGGRAAAVGGPACPSIVHGGGPEITRTLERTGAQVRVRPTGGASPAQQGSTWSKWSSTGRMNADLVALINGGAARAVGISGKDGACCARRRSRRQATVLAGEIEARQRDVARPVPRQGLHPGHLADGFGEDGAQLPPRARTWRRREIAVVFEAEQADSPADAPGILGWRAERSRRSAPRAKIDAGIVAGGARLARSGLCAIDGGVRAVHVVDGRVPHGVIAELFTDRGVGTWVT